MNVELKNISKKYGNQIVLNNINTYFNEGGITGLIGPNGAGKTTLMKIICGLITPDEGKIFVNGSLLDNNSITFKKKLGYLPETNPLYSDMYVTEYLMFVGEMYGIKNPELKQKVNEIIEITGITLEKNKKIKYLSKGYRQRVGIAQTLIHNPELIILDEPTSGLDPNQIIEIRNLIKKVSFNKTIILSTHILQEVEAICNRVIILDKGNIVADDIPQNLKHKTEFQTIIIEIDSNINENIFNLPDKIANVKKLKSNIFIIESLEKTDIR